MRYKIIALFISGILTISCNQENTKYQKQLFPDVKTTPVTKITCTQDTTQSYMLFSEILHTKSYEKTSVNKRKNTEY